MKIVQNIELEVELSIERSKSLTDFDCVEVLLAVGEPGSGKSFLGKTLTKIFTGKYTEENFQFIQCTSGTMPHHFVYDINAIGVAEKVVGNLHAETISKGVLVKTLEKSLTQKVVLIIDELDKASREVDPFLLDFFQEFRIMDPVYGNIYGNKSNCIILITSNDERSFVDAIYRRCSLIEVPYPTEEELLSRLKKMFVDLDIDLAKKLIKYFTKIRSIQTLSYKPTISELQKILHDWKHIKDRSELNEILIYKTSKDLDDRKYLLKEKVFFN